MTDRDLATLSKEELIRELERLQVRERPSATDVKDTEREQLIHDLHTHQVELEMQNRELRESQERLEEASSRYADLYEFAPVGYCTLDPEGRVREINLTGAALLGAPRQDLIGKTFPSIAPLKDKRAFQAHMKRCAKGEARVTSELTLRLGALGTRIVQFVSEPVRDGHGRATAAYRTILSDISELKDLEHKLRLLSDAGAALAISLDATTTLEIAARVAVPSLADLCMVDLRDEGGEIHRAAVVFADPKKQEAQAQRWKQLSPRQGWQSPQARVIASGEPILLEEVSEQLRSQLAYDDEHAAALRAAEIRSLMIVPLSAHGHAFGALTLAAAESGRRYASSDLHLAQDLASRIALALDNARLHTEAQRANLGLRLAEAKSSGIVSISADAIISIDESQRITLFNAGAEKIFGYSNAEAMGAPLAILVPERLRAMHCRHVERFAAGEGAARRMGERGEGVVGLRKNGEEFPADAAISKLVANGETIFTVSLRDISDQKETERHQTFLAELGLALANTLEYEETLSVIAREVLREFGDVCIIDVLGEGRELRKLEVLSTDPAKAALAASIKGRAVNQDNPFLSSAILQSKRAQLISPETLAAVAQDEGNRQLLEGARGGTTMGAPLIVRGQLLGALVVVSCRGEHEYRASDLQLFEQVGLRASLALESARLYRTAERAIRARDEVLGIVAHDLRNPLGAILFQAELLRRPGPEPDRRSREPATIIKRAVNRMNRLIQDLLEVTRMEAGILSVQKDPVSPAQVASEALESQKQLAASASLELRLEVASNLPDVSADHDRLLQVFENLIGNAVKFTKAGGHVTVGAASRDREIVFSVADTGCGIAQKDLPHAFDRFWQARRQGQRGSGLGLPVVKGIVEAHGGRVWVESEVGVGSTFFFTVPLPASD